MCYLILSLVCLSCVTACSLSAAPQAAASTTVTAVPTSAPTSIAAQPTNIPPTATITPPPPVAQPLTNTGGCTVTTAWTATYTVVSGDTLFNIAQRTGSSVDELGAANCIGDAGQINAGQVLRVPLLIPAIDSSQPSGGGGLTYYLVSETTIHGGIPVGCEGSLIAAFTGTSITSDPAADLKTSLNTLLSMTSVEVGQSGLKNYLAGQGLSVAGITVQNGEAVITINGTLPLIGSCADPQIEAQILLTVFAVPGIQRAYIIIGERNMKQIFDSSSLVGAEAVYVLGDVRRR